MPPLELRGFKIYKEYLSKHEQNRIVEDVRTVIQAAPLFSLKTAWGKPMSVATSSAGKYGWYSDKNGYRYEKCHPNGVAWPKIPESILSVWENLVRDTRAPDCCLINLYKEDAKMGLHQDKDENDFSFPVLSISLGDSGLFRIGNHERGGKTESIWLDSGDVCLMGGDARLTYHGVDRIRFGSSDLLKNGGRLNLTLRVVD